MRARRLVLAAALPLALALASCSGGAAAPEAASTPVPTAIATPEAASTPAPTAIATPAATSTPAPTAIATPAATSTPAPTATATPEATLPPEQACANGVAVADPEAHPGLVADCEMLLRAKDALRGDASLDWGGGLAVAEWEGVAVSGEPPRVTGLDLRGKGLTGSIPRELRRLRLGEVRLGGNALTGCVPSAFEDASGDAASLGLPWCLRYDRLDAAGEVAEAGEWAILGGNGEVLATWEQLRSEAATLRVHQTDAGGNSWASEFGAVAVNDLFEWREASLYPEDWAGPVESKIRHESPSVAAEEASGSSARSATPVTFGVADSLAEARRFQYWRDPVLPAGWTFAGAETGSPNSPVSGYCALYLNTQGYHGRRRREEGCAFPRCAGARARRLLRRRRRARGRLGPRADCRRHA